MKLKVLFILALAFCLNGFVFGQEVLVTPEQQRGYLIGPGDVLSVRVLGEKDFDIEAATVDEDGNIEVPFSDTPVMAKCKTEKELRAEVTKVISKYLRNPQLSLRVTERKSRPPATIYGEVRQQQQVVLTRKARLLELLSSAGGVTKDAGGMVQVFRTQPPICSDGTEEKWLSSSTDATDVPSRMYSITSVKQGREEANPEILPGDIIVVQKAPPVYVIGEVNAIKEILIKENGLSLSEAIAQAGGVNREAKKKDIVIQRVNPQSRDKRDIISVNYELIRKGEQKDIMLEPDDIVIVNKTKKSVTDTILEIVTGGAKNAATILPTIIL